VLRGIPKADDCHCDLEGRHTFKPTAFKPDKRSTETRADRCQELSVNCEDDDGALAQLTSRKNLNWIARVEIADIQELVGKGLLVGHERSPSKDNAYHGDILFPDCETWKTTLAQSALAVRATNAAPKPK
jgi:hypothetical protein